MPTFLTKNEYKKSGMPANWKQMFKYLPTQTCSVSKRKLLELVATGVISEEDLVLLRALYRFHMATPEQLLKLTGLDMEEYELRKRIDKLTQYRVANKFIIVEPGYAQPAALNRDDAFVVYTIDVGGAVLMDHVSDYEECASWKISNIAFDSFDPSKAMNTSTKTQKRLMLTDFYLRLQEEIGERLLKFEVAPIICCENEKVRPRALFTVVNAQGKICNFVYESVFESELNSRDEVKFREKLIRLSDIMKDKWKYAFRGDVAPSLILVTDTDYAAKEAGAMLTGAGIASFRMTTAQRLKHKLNAHGTFVKFIDTDGVETIADTSIAMFGNKAK